MRFLGVFLLLSGKWSLHFCRWILKKNFWLIIQYHVKPFLPATSNIKVHICLFHYHHASEMQTWLLISSKVCFSALLGCFAVSRMRKSTFEIIIIKDYCILWKWLNSNVNFKWTCLKSPRLDFRYRSGYVKWFRGHQSILRLM